MVFTGLNLLYYFLNRTDKVKNDGFFELDKFKKGYYFVKEGNADSYKNYSFKIYELDEKERISKPMFFVKQAKKFDSQSLLDIDAEVRALEIFYKNKVLNTYIPTLIDADFNNGFIATTYLDGVNLRDYLIGKHRFIGIGKNAESTISSIFKEMAILLASLHKLPYKNEFAEYTPMPFQLNEEFLNNISKILKLKNADIVSKNIPSQLTIDNLRAIIPFLKQIDYKKNALIHRDAHFRNFIFRPIHNGFELKMIDWEMTSKGDRYWDLAKVLSSLLNIGNNTTDEEKMFISKIIKQFWNDYHAISKKKKGENTILKVINFIVCEKLLRQLELMLTGEEVDADKVSEILRFFQNPKSVVINYINLYDELTSA